METKHFTKDSFHHYPTSSYYYYSQQQSSPPLFPNDKQKYQSLQPSMHHQASPTPYHYCFKSFHSSSDYDDERQTIRHHPNSSSPHRFEHESQQYHFTDSSTDSTTDHKKQQVYHRYHHHNSHHLETYPVASYPHTDKEQLSHQDRRNQTHHSETLNLMDKTKHSTTSSSCIRSINYSSSDNKYRESMESSSDHFYTSKRNYHPNELYHTYDITDNSYPHKIRESMTTHSVVKNDYLKRKHHSLLYSDNTLNEQLQLIDRYHSPLNKEVTHSYHQRSLSPPLYHQSSSNGIITYPSLPLHDLKTLSPLPLDTISSTHDTTDDHHTRVSSHRQSSKHIILYDDTRQSDGCSSNHDIDTVEDPIILPHSQPYIQSHQQQLHHVTLSPSSVSSTHHTVHQSLSHTIDPIVEVNHSIELPTDKSFKSLRLNKTSTSSFIIETQPVNLNQHYYSNNNTEAYHHHIPSTPSSSSSQIESQRRQSSSVASHITTQLQPVFNTQSTKIDVQQQQKRVVSSIQSITTDYSTVEQKDYCHTHSLQTCPYTMDPYRSIQSSQETRLIQHRTTGDYEEGEEHDEKLKTSPSVIQFNPLTTKQQYKSLLQKTSSHDLDTSVHNVYNTIYTHSSKNRSHLPIGTDYCMDDASSYNKKMMQTLYYNKPRRQSSYNKNDKSYHSHWKRSSSFIVENEIPDTFEHKKEIIIHDQYEGAEICQTKNNLDMKRRRHLHYTPRDTSQEFNETIQQSRHHQVYNKYQSFKQTYNHKNSHKYSMKPSYRLTRQQYNYRSRSSTRSSYPESMYYPSTDDEQSGNNDNVKKYSKQFNLHELNDLSLKRQETIHPQDQLNDDTQSVVSIPLYTQDHHMTAQEQQNDLLASSLSSNQEINLLMSQVNVIHGNSIFQEKKSITDNLSTIGSLQHDSQCDPFYETHKHGIESIGLHTHSSLSVSQPVVNTAAVVHNQVSTTTVEYQPHHLENINKTFSTLKEGSHSSFSDVSSPKTTLVDVSINHTLSNSDHSLNKSTSENNLTFNHLLDNCQNYLTSQITPSDSTNSETSFPVLNNACSISGSLTADVIPPNNDGLRTIVSQETVINEDAKTNLLLRNTMNSIPESSMVINTKRSSTTSDEELDTMCNTSREEIQNDLILHHLNKNIGSVNTIRESETMEHEFISYQDRQSSNTPLCISTSTEIIPKNSTLTRQIKLRQSRESLITKDSSINASPCDVSSSGNHTPDVRRFESKHSNKYHEAMEKNVKLKQVKLAPENTHLENVPSCDSYVPDIKGGRQRCKRKVLHSDSSDGEESFSAPIAVELASAEKLAVNPSITSLPSAFNDDNLLIFGTITSSVKDTTIDVSHDNLNEAKFSPSLLQTDETITLLNTLTKPCCSTSAVGENVNSNNTDTSCKPEIIPTTTHVDNEYMTPTNHVVQKKGSPETSSSTRSHGFLTVPRLKRRSLRIVDSGSDEEPQGLSSPKVNNKTTICSSLPVAGTLLSKEPGTEPNDSSTVSDSSCLKSSNKYAPPQISKVSIVIPVLPVTEPLFLSDVAIPRKKGSVTSSMKIDSGRTVKLTTSRSDDDYQLSENDNSNFVESLRKPENNSNYGISSDVPYEKNDMTDTQVFRHEQQYQVAGKKPLKLYNKDCKNGEESGKIKMKKHRILTVENSSTRGEQIRSSQQLNGKKIPHIIRKPGGLVKARNQSVRNDISPCKEEKRKPYNVSEVNVLLNDSDPFISCEFRSSNRETMSLQQTHNEENHYEEKDYEDIPITRRSYEKRRYLSLAETEESDHISEQLFVDTPVSLSEEVGLVSNSSVFKKIDDDSDRSSKHIKTGTCKISSKAKLKNGRIGSTEILTDGGSHIVMRRSEEKLREQESNSSEQIMPREIPLCEEEPINNIHIEQLNDRNIKIASTNLQPVGKPKRFIKTECLSKTIGFEIPKVDHEGSYNETLKLNSDESLPRLIKDKSRNSITNGNRSKHKSVETLSETTSQPSGHSTTIGKSMKGFRKKSLEFSLREKEKSHITSTESCSEVEVEDGHDSRTKNLDLLNDSSPNKKIQKKKGIEATSASVVSPATVPKFSRELCNLYQHLIDSGASHFLLDSVPTKRVREDVSESKHPKINHRNLKDIQLKRSTVKSTPSRNKVNSLDNSINSREADCSKKQIGLNKLSNITNSSLSDDNVYKGTVKRSRRSGSLTKQPHQRSSMVDHSSYGKNEKENTKPKYTLKPVTTDTELLSQGFSSEKQQKHSNYLKNYASSHALQDDHKPVFDVQCNNTLLVENFKLDVGQKHELDNDDNNTVPEKINPNIESPLSCVIEEDSILLISKIANDSDLPKITKKSTQSSLIDETTDTNPSNHPNTLLINTPVLPSINCGYNNKNIMQTPLLSDVQPDITSNPSTKLSPIFIENNLGEQQQQENLSLTTFSPPPLRDISIQQGQQLNGAYLKEHSNVCNVLESNSLNDTPSFKRAKKRTTFSNEAHLRTNEKLIKHPKNYESFTSNFPKVQLSQPDTPTRNESPIISSCKAPPQPVTLVNDDSNILTSLAQVPSASILNLSYDGESDSSTEQNKFHEVSLDKRFLARRFLPYTQRCAVSTNWFKMLYSLEL